VTPPPDRPRVVLICHHDSPLHADGLARWLASWADLAGIVLIREPRGLLLRRLRRERQRVGMLRLIDVLALRLYYRLTTARRDAAWLEERLRLLQARYPAATAVPTIEVASPNQPEAQRFLGQARPTLAIALCKNILAERIFSIPTQGTFVLHPGICPEYRNAHGCFWALAEEDHERVGMTVLRIDRGVDTGPVFGYFTTGFDEIRDSHIRIQHAMTLENLAEIAALFRRVHEGQARPIDTAGRPSGAWGQPWLSRYLRWKRAARRRQRARHHA
jgi:hypothetical protein